MPLAIAAQTGEVVPAERLQAREAYRDARFGMLIHGGAYSQLGNGEWVMQTEGLRVDEYEWLATALDPVKFDAEAWVDVAKAAGMRYITITARHRDGSTMFDTDATDYDIRKDARHGRERRLHAHAGRSHAGAAPRRGG